jgi:hypothetical protein
MLDIESRLHASAQTRPIAPMLRHRVLKRSPRATAWLEAHR